MQYYGNKPVSVGRENFHERKGKLICVIIVVLVVVATVVAIRTAIIPQTPMVAILVVAVVAFCLGF